MGKIDFNSPEVAGEDPINWPNCHGFLISGPEGERLQEDSHVDGCDWDAIVPDFRALGVTEIEVNSGDELHGQFFGADEASRRYTDAELSVVNTEMIHDGIYTIDQLDRLLKAILELVSGELRLG